MDKFRTCRMIIAKSILIMCLLQLSFVAVDADNVKCTYNSLISNFNRKVHEDGSKFYYECDERTSYYVEKMCAVDESFDVKKLTCTKDNEDNDMLPSARFTQSQSKICRGKEDGVRIANYVEKCETFYICNDGMPVETSCPTGLLFNPKSKNCDWPANVNCVCQSNECMLPSKEDSNEYIDESTEHEGDATEEEEEEATIQPTPPWPSSTTLFTPTTTDCAPARPTVPTTPAWEDICVDGTPEDTLPPCDTTTEGIPTPSTPSTSPTWPTWPPTNTPEWPPTNTPEWPPTNTPEWPPTNTPQWPPTNTPPTPPPTTTTEWPSHCPTTTACPPCNCQPDTTFWSSISPETTVNHWPTITHPECPPSGCVTLSSTIIVSPPMPSTTVSSATIDECPPGGCVDGVPETTPNIPEAGPPLPTPSTPRPPSYQGKPEFHRPFDNDFAQNYQ